MNEIKRYTNEFEALISNVDLTGKTVLDVGCGVGKLTRLISGYCEKIYGIDLPEIIEIARKTEYKENTIFLPGTAQQLPVEDNLADIIIYFASFHHVPPEEMDNAFKECKRVLKPGGLVCFVEPIARAGSYFELASLVNDETEIQKIAYDKIIALPTNHFAAKLETFGYLERSYNDFENHIKIYTTDESRKNEILSKAKEVLMQKKFRPEEKGFHSHFRLNIFEKTV